MATSKRAAAPPMDSPVRLTAQHMRWCLIALALGAVLYATGTLAASGFHSAHGLSAHDPDSAQPGGRANNTFGAAKAGDCLTWTKVDFTDLTKVNCADKHLFEVTADVDLSKFPGREFAPGARFPDAARFAQLRTEHCMPAAQTYLGGRLDPRGRFVVGVINPSELGWRAGDRTIRCGLQLISASGNPTRQVTGRVRESDQSRVFDAGVCIGINQSLPTYEPVDCAKPHALEVMSTEDLSTRFPAGPPERTEQDKFMEEQCGKVINDYLGSPEAMTNKTLTAFWDDIDARSWLVGSHKLNCLVGKGSADAFATLTGTARGDVLIDGQPPVAPNNNGRYTPAPLPGAAPPR